MREAATKRLILLIDQPNIRELAVTENQRVKLWSLCNPDILINENMVKTTFTYKIVLYQSLLSDRYEIS